MRETTLVKKATNKDFFPTKAGEFVPIIVVYKVASDTWRGFVHPYGETTEAETKQEAIERMRVLTDAYKVAVGEYGNPKHLVYAGINKSTDKKVFAWIVGNQELMKKIHSEEERVDSEEFYVEAYRD